MNIYQRIILVIVAMILVLMLIFPPFQSLTPDGIVLNEGYSFIMKPPIFESYTGNYIWPVNVSLLLLQYLIIGVNYNISKGL